MAHSIVNILTDGERSKRKYLFQAEHLLTQFLKKTKGRRCEWSPFKAQYRVSWNQKRCRAELRISDHGSGLRRIGKCHLNKLWRKNLLYQIMVPDSKDKASLQVELSKSTAGIRALGGIYTFWTMRSILSQIKTTLRSAK